MDGSTVCRMHGGSAPQVKRKAALRLVELIDPAIGTLAREMVQAPSSADRQRAANSILDRAGVARRTEVSHEDTRSLVLERFAQWQEERRMAELDNLQVIEEATDETD